MFSVVKNLQWKEFNKRSLINYRADLGIEIGIRIFFGYFWESESESESFFYFWESESESFFSFFQMIPSPATEKPAYKNVKVIKEQKCSVLYLLFCLHVDNYDLLEM